MVLLEDTRNQTGKHKNIHDYCKRNGIEIVRSKMLVGDYTLPTDQSICIDTKMNMNEICNNVVQDHARFVRELELARSCGIHLVVLIEHSRDIKTLEDVRHWVNPRSKVSPMAVSGERLFKILYAIQKRYDCEFLFCDKSQTGKRIIEILGGKHESAV